MYKFAFQLIRMQTSYAAAPRGEQSGTNATTFAKLLIKVKKLSKKSSFKLVVGHTTKQIKHGGSCDIQI